MHVSLTKQQGHAAHTKPACTTPHTTVTTSTHNPLIMASSSSASGWECGACASSNMGGKYCAMCATPRPKNQALLAALAADVASHTAVVAVPAEVVKAIQSAPTPEALVGMPAAVVGMPMAVVAVPLAAVSVAVATATMSLLRFS
jgi:hypothetical protein